MTKRRHVKLLKLKSRKRRRNPSISVEFDLGANLGDGLLGLAVGIARAFIPNLDEFLRDPQTQIPRPQRGPGAPPPLPPRPRINWRRVMGFGDFYAPDKAQILARFKELSRQRHPDAGGTHQAMVELVAARDAALAECSH